ncbi:MAG: PQQ-like beta-propeller repeat protein [Lentisphaeria bacterium]|nr:PQQ-like beta-propeller repeat protein [Lentisphaeria bacterium]
MADRHFALVRNTCALAVLAVSTFVATADDWPNFLGPNHDSTSAETGLARSWPEGGPPVRWTAKLGSGFGGAAVVGEKVFVFDRILNQADVLRCFNLETGKEVWQYKYETGPDRKYGGSHSVPTVTNDSVYTLGPHGDLLCISRKTHQPIWRRNLVEEYGARQPGWLIGQSPLLIGGKIVVIPTSAKAGVLALDAKTGEQAWAWTGSAGKVAYCSPVSAKIGGVEQVLALIGRNTLVSLAPADGKELWRHTEWSCSIPIPSPKVFPDGRVFLTGGYGAGSAMIQVTKQGDTFSSKTLYKTDVCGSQIHQPLLHGEFLYLGSNGNKRKDGFACIDLEGNLKWKSGRKQSFERGDLLLAGGLIFAVNGNGGELALIEPSPEGLKIVSRVKVLQGRQIWAPMALGSGRLLIRDQKQLKCIDVRQGAK